MSALKRRAEWERDISPSFSSAVIYSHRTRINFLRPHLVIPPDSISNLRKKKSFSSTRFLLADRREILVLLYRIQPLTINTECRKTLSVKGKLLRRIRGENKSRWWKFVLILLREWKEKPFYFLVESSKRLSWDTLSRMFTYLRLRSINWKVLQAEKRFRGKT